MTGPKNFTEDVHLDPLNDNNPTPDDLNFEKDVEHIDDLDCPCDDCEEERNDNLQQYYNEL